MAWDCFGVPTRPMPENADPGSLHIGEVLAVSLPDQYSPPMLTIKVLASEGDAPLGRGDIVRRSSAIGLGHTHFSAPRGQ